MSRNEGKPRADVYARITDRIVADLERGVRPWVRPWNAVDADGCITRPLRHNGMPDQGINVVLLWSEAVSRGFTSPMWMTFKQSLKLGGHVRKGERGTMVVYANKITKTETDDNGDDVERTVPFLRAYTVFCVDQIDGLPDHYYARSAPSTRRRNASRMRTRSSPTPARPSGTAATRRSLHHRSTSSRCRPLRPFTTPRAMRPRSRMSACTGPRRRTASIAISAATRRTAACAPAKS
jgi:hypothetical protein